MEFANVIHVLPIKLSRWMVLALAPAQQDSKLTWLPKDVFKLFKWWLLKFLNQHVDNHSAANVDKTVIPALFLNVTHAARLSNRPRPAHCSKDLLTVFAKSAQWVLLLQQVVSALIANQVWRPQMEGLVLPLSYHVDQEKEESATPCVLHAHYTLISP